MDITLATVFSEDLALECIWFRMPYLEKQLTVGQPFIFYGVLSKEGHRFKMEQPTIYTPDKYLSMRNCLQPVYSLTKGMTQQMVRKITASALDEIDDIEQECLPLAIVEREHFPSHLQAIHKIHFPENFASLTEAAQTHCIRGIFLFYITQSYFRSWNNGHIESVDIFGYKNDGYGHAKTAV